MPEIYLDIPQSVVNQINDNIRQINYRHPESKSLSANDICKEALAVYKWAIEQTAEGYAIVTMNINREIVCQISTPNLPARPPTK